jgi:hypothetical protein
LERSTAQQRRGGPINNVMAFSVKSHSLSALSPVNFTYHYNSEEKIKSTLNLYQGNFGYYEHDLLSNFKDAALSKKNCLILTDVKSLKEVFQKPFTTLLIGTISGSLYLKTSDGKYVTTKDNHLYAGGVGQKAFISIIPQQDGTVELKLGKNKYIEIQETYPYTVNISEALVGETNRAKRRFQIDYKDNKITFKILTSEGYRFLSYSSACSERIIRAIGVELNDTIVNPYKFSTEFVSTPSMLYNFNSQTKEIKYFNELLAFETRQTVDIKEQTTNETNLIVSCPTSTLSKSLSAVNVNIALAKTNFSSSGTYSPIK